GIMGQVVGGPRTAPDWSWNNPTEAAAEFAARRDDFVIEPPPFPFNEGNVTEMVTYWPGAWLKRVEERGPERPQRMTRPWPVGSSSTWYPRSAKTASSTSFCSR